MNMRYTKQLGQLCVAAALASFPLSAAADFCESVVDAIVCSPSNEGGGVAMVDYTGYMEYTSPFAQSGFNNEATKMYDHNDRARFAFHCIDSVFLHFINPLGTEDAHLYRLGDPDSTVEVRVYVDGQISNINATVSPSGMSILGDELTALSLGMVDIGGPSEFAISIAGRGQQIMSRIKFTGAEKIVLQRVAQNCDLVDH